MYERYSLPEEYDASANRQLCCLKILTADMQQLIKACIAYDVVPPTEVKLTYDIVNNKLDAAYKYDEIITNTDKTANEIAAEWFRELQK